MNINNVLNILTTSITKNSVPNFKGNTPKLPEIPYDSFEYTNNNDNTITKIKEPIRGKEAFRYYLASTDVDYNGGMQTLKRKNLGDERTLMDTIVVFDADKAVDLEKQDVFKKLKDGESVEMGCYLYDKQSKADYKLNLPDDWVFNNATIVKKNGNFIISNTPAVFGRLATARKSKLEEDTENNLKYMYTIPQKKGEYYFKQYFNHRNLLPKNEKIYLCKMSDLYNCDDIFVLPANKNGYTEHCIPIGCAKSEADRIEMFSQVADTIIIFPGSAGTLQEATTLISKNYYGKQEDKKKIILAGKDFFNGLIEQYNKLYETGLIKCQPSELFTVVDDEEELVCRLYET